MAVNKTDYNIGPYRINPKGTYDNTKPYKFLDVVNYNGSSYLLYNEDTIDGDVCIGVAPEGNDASETYWMQLSARGDVGPEASTYKEFLTITDGNWNYNNSDKIIIPSTGIQTLNITNVYDGCCGIVLSPLEITMPFNSQYSIDYNYITSLEPNQYYMYTFVYIDNGFDSHSHFIWNRTVVNG